MIKLILIFSLLGNICYADTNVTFLSKNSPAPYDGFLFTRTATLDAYHAEQQLPQYKLLNESLTTSLNLSQKSEEIKIQEVSVLSNENVNLRNTIEKQKNITTLEKILYFTSGVILTVLAIEGAHAAFH